MNDLTRSLARLAFERSFTALDTPSFGRLTSGPMSPFENFGSVGKVYITERLNGHAFGHAVWIGDVERGVACIARQGSDGM